MSELDVLIIDDAQSREALLVEESLADQGAANERLNCSDLDGWSIRANPGEFKIESDIAEWSVLPTTSVWFRRLGAPDVGTYDHLEAQLVQDELPHIFLGGLAACGVRWVDEPFTVERAERKLYQLAVAKRVGLKLAESLVTNDVAAARGQLSSMRLVAKPLSPGQGISPHTEAVTEEDLRLVSDLPVLLQEFIADATADLRVVVVGSQAWAWRRLRATDVVDWRATDPHGLDFVHDEDDRVLQDAIDLTKALGLTMSVQDWLDSPRGPVFLEANPQGAWAFLDGAEETVPRAIAAHLHGVMDSEPSGGKWPKPHRRILWDLGRASKAPSKDGVEPPTLAPPPWASLVARSSEAIAVARRAHDEVMDGVKTAEEKAARLTRTSLTIAAVGTALLAYHLGLIIDQTRWLLLTLMPAAGSIVSLAVATINAIDIDRVGVYRHPSAEDLAAPGPQDPSVKVIELEEVGRQLTSWNSRMKHTALMQARAWFSRGLVLLAAAVIAAVVLWGIEIGTSTDDPTPPANPPARTGQ